MELLKLDKPKPKKCIFRWFVFGTALPSDPNGYYVSYKSFRRSNTISTVVCDEQSLSCGELSLPRFGWLASAVR